MPSGLDQEVSMHFVARRGSSGEEVSDITEESFDAEQASALVSVVIPTRGRALLATRAVRGVLRQTFRRLEVIVVIDGPDVETEYVMNKIPDERLRVLSLPANVGGSEARNIGVRNANAEWIAFLDDDDEWLPDKLAKQWPIVAASPERHRLITCRFIERTEFAERTLPRRAPRPGEDFSEYLFVREGWHSGETFLQTSTWLVCRELMQEVPFTPGLKRCQDLDWLLHATAQPDIKVVLVPDVLTIFHHDERRERVSRRSDWKFLYEWAMTNRKYFTPRALSFFVATFCVPSAAKEGEGLSTLIFLLGRCLFGGRSNIKCLALFFGCWLVPEDLRRNVRASISRSRHTMLRMRLRLMPQASGTEASQSWR